MSPRSALALLIQISENHASGSERRIRFHDPMCGSGTTALVARALGFAVSASDIMYPAATITRAKLFRLGDSALKELAEFPNSLEPSNKKLPDNQWQNWRLWFKPKVLGSLEDISEAIASLRAKSFFPHLLTALFQTTWDVSAADKGVAVPTRSRFSPSPPRLSARKVTSVFRRRIKRIVKAQYALKELFFSTSKPSVRQANALDGGAWPEDRLDVIFTSPPYGCGVDYERAFRLQMRLGNRFSSKTYPKSDFVGRVAPISSNLAVVPTWDQENNWLKGIASSNDDRLAMFRQYVQDIQSLIQVSARRLAKNGRLCLVVGNPQIGKRRVPLVRIIQNIASREGLKPYSNPQTDKIRTRMQNFPLRSATSHIAREYFLSFTAN
jgi:hypothetical protein